ncbi:MAG: rod shape-determining protein MreC [Flavobacteriales bacterium]|nr:rod shape-determining protein MreC [Flavobacteriales bacterium]
MRNLWLLLQRHAFLLVFALLLVVSLMVLIQNDGSARSSWFRTTGGVVSMVENQQQQWTNYLQLAEQNASLAAENAALRSRLLSMKLTDAWRADSTHGWRVKTGWLVKGPDGLPRTMAMATPGLDDSVRIGTGVLATGTAFGTVVDLGEHHARILPLLNTAGTWSCRLGQNGAVAPLSWDGVDPNKLTLNDVPRYVQWTAGDTVFTSGFDLKFPEGIPVGTVTEEVPSPGSEFKTILVAPMLDLKSVRHIEFIQSVSDSERTVLAQPMPAP